MIPLCPFSDAAAHWVQNGKTPKLLEEGRPEALKDSQSLGPLIRHLEEILRDTHDQLHGPPKPWLDKDICVAGAHTYRPLPSTQAVPEKILENGGPRTSSCRSQGLIEHTVPSHPGVEHRGQRR